MADQMTVAIIGTEQKTLMENHWALRHTQTHTKTFYYYFLRPEKEIIFVLQRKMTTMT